jgi:hypothetical protein
VRNYLVLDRFVFITTDTAELFWRGNNPVATGSAVLVDGRGIFSGAPKDFQRAIFARDEGGQADLFRETAWAFVREHPAWFLALTLRKWVSFWWFPATAGLGYPAHWLFLYRLFYILLLAGALVGLIVACRRPERGRGGLALVLVMLGCLSVAQSLF